MSNYQHSKLLAGLLPPGTALKPDPGTNLRKILDGMGVEFDRFADACENLILESNPLTMNTMLPVRYLEAGLPRSCRGNFTIEFEQKQEVIATWANRGGANPAYLEWVAGLYGYEVKIFEYPVFHIEDTGIETGIGLDDEFAHTFSVNFAYVPTALFHPFLIELTTVESLGIDDGNYPVIVHEDPVYIRPKWLVESTAVESGLGFDDTYEDEKDYAGIGYFGNSASWETFPQYDIACVMSRIKPCHTTAVYTEWPLGTDIKSVTPSWY